MNWNRRRVLLTGHTGFKGSWLSLWLQNQGADLCGIALEPPTRVNMFQDARLRRWNAIGPRRYTRCWDAQTNFAEFRPEIVFHLAAQSSVRRSYEGSTGHLLHQCDGHGQRARSRTSQRQPAGSHRNYQRQVLSQHEWEWPYRETDPLGGYDPYSNSKACAELVVAAYRDSFFNPKDYRRHGVASHLSAPAM
jgi:CDP-glucose 4,6-dehydratase